MKEYKVVLISMSGVRVYNKRLLELGLTLPGFLDRSKVIASLPSLGLLTLASHTPENWEVVYRELDDYVDSDLEEIINLSPNLIAFSSLTARINETYLLSNKFRKLGFITSIGGLHVSALPEEGIKYADSIIQGEGEIIWETLLQDFENNQLKPLYSSITNKNFTFHLNDSRIPKYELLDITKYNRLTIQTTRGCPLHCSFCAASRTISTYKKKPIEQIEKELNRIFEVWNRPFVELADDNTFIDKVWSKELLKLFSKYKMKWFTETDISVAYDDELLQLLAKSNCAQVLIGFETTSAKGLEGIDKGNWKFKQFDNYLKAIDKIQSHGISVNGCFILGFDTDTTKTFKETELFIKESNLSEVQITLLTPFPNTDLYNQLKEENRLLSENYWDKCTLFDVNFIPKHFTVLELENSFQELMQNVYAETAVKERKNKFKQALRNKANFQTI
jgi:radical SAM superfamily enzyme YgiQ (UPF0313 family)